MFRFTYGLICLYTYTVVLRGFFVEIFPISFRYAKSNLPYSLRYPASVPFGHSLLLVGGLSADLGDVYTDTVLEFDVASEGWITRKEKLKTGKILFGAALVEDSIADCV